MRVPGSWRMSVDGRLRVPVAPSPSPSGGPTRIRSLLPESARNQPRALQPRYAPDSNMSWTAYFEPAYFERRHAELLAVTKSAEPPDCFNFEGRRLWWGVHDHTLDVVLAHIEDGNSPRVEYPAPPRSPAAMTWCLVINEGDVPSPSASSSRLVKPKAEPALLPMKECEAMAADEESVLKWARDN
ncbi:hypothetical protein D1007_23838 [Hordeum vulgare]|nr:hypothetical protein D1007_23838 [Hordeum vulgare]